MRFSPKTTAALLLLLAGCATALEPSFRSFNDLDYNFPVQRQALPDGLELAYVSVGEGPETLLFVHGLGSYLPAWNQNLTALSGRYRCVAVDLPGYGQSSKGYYDADMDFFADALLAFLRAQGIERVTVVGHSMGGQIAMVMALKAPQTVERLILAAPAGFETFTPGEARWFRQNITAEGVALTTADQVRANLHSNFYNFPPSAEFMITDRLALRQAAEFPMYCHVVAQSVHGMVDQPVYDYLPDIEQPTLIVFGENDQLIPNRFLNGGTTARVAAAGDERLPNSTVTLVPKAGHFVQYEAAEAFNAAVRQFLP